MKILYSAYKCNPYKGSESGLGWNWAYNNALLGHDVWCMTHASEKESIEKKMEELQGLNLKFIYVDLPIWIRKLNKYLPGVYFNYMLWQHAAYKASKKLHSDVKFDIIHHTSWGSFQMGSELWKLDAPLIFGPVGGGQVAPEAFKCYFYESWKSEINRKYMSSILMRINPNFSKFVKKTALFLVTNDETLQLARKSGIENVSFFLDNGLPKEFYPSSVPKRGTNKVFKILWVGRLLARKGLPLVMEALSKVSPETKFKFTIVGDGPMAKYMPDWINDFGLRDSAEWVGQIPWEKVKNAYRVSDVFMFCSLRDSAAVQLMEAMAYGLPIITLNHHGGKRAVPKDAGIKVDPTSKEETILKLAEAVEVLYKDPLLRQKMGESGFKFAQTCTWTKKAEQVQKYYQQVMNKKSFEDSLSDKIEKHKITQVAANIP